MRWTRKWQKKRRKRRKKGRRRRKGAVRGGRAKLEKRKKEIPHVTGTSRGDRIQMVWKLVRNILLLGQMAHQLF